MTEKAAAATNDAKKAAEKDIKKVIEREPGNIINNFHEFIFAKYDHFFDVLGAAATCVILMHFIQGE